MKRLLPLRPLLHIRMHHEKLPIQPLFHDHEPRVVAHHIPVRVVLRDAPRVVVYPHVVRELLPRGDDGEVVEAGHGGRAGVIFGEEGGVRVTVSGVVEEGVEGV